MGQGGEDRMRVDKWLWQARFFKTRSRATAIVTSGHLRINSGRCTKPAQTVTPGDVLTLVQGRIVRVIRVDAIGGRRGPAVEAATLYTDLDAPATAAGRGGTPPAEPPAAPRREPGGGRPTKRARREIDRLRRFDP